MPDAVHEVWTWWQGALSDLKEEQRRHALTKQSERTAWSLVEELRAQNGRQSARIGELRKLLNVDKATDPTRNRREQTRLY